MAPKSIRTRGRRWERWLAEWRRSGQRPGEFCRRQRLALWQFYYWRRRLAAPATGKEAAAAPRFLPVRLMAAARGRTVGRIGLRLRNGRVLHFELGVEVEPLRRLADALEGGGAAC